MISEGLSVIETWGKRFNILRHGYSGGGYDGNNTKRILDHCEDLRYYLPNAIDCVPAIDALQALRHVVDGEYKIQETFF